MTRLGGGVIQSVGNQGSTGQARYGTEENTYLRAESLCPLGAGFFVPLLRQHPGERPWWVGLSLLAGPACLEVGVGGLQQERPQWSASMWTDVLRSDKGQGQGQGTDGISYSQESIPNLDLMLTLNLVYY